MVSGRRIEYNITMSGFLGGILLFIFSVIFFVLLPIGLIRPSLFSSWFGGSISRGGILKYFGTTALFAMIGGSVLMPSQATDEPARQQIAPISEILPATDEKTAESVQEPQIETREEIELEAIQFETEKTFSNTIPSGKTEVVTRGEKGQVRITYEVTYTDGDETSRKEISREVIKEPTTQVVAHGTYVQPAAPQPSTVAPVSGGGSSCDPNYSPCVPYSSTDLDCGDIGFRVTVIGNDPHGFDRDNDGQGCESY